MDALSNLLKLPETCAARLLSDNSPILIVRGEMGYRSLLNITNFDPDGYNRRRNITHHNSAMPWSMVAALVGRLLPPTLIATCMLTPRKLHNNGSGNTLFYCKSLDIANLPTFM